MRKAANSSWRTSGSCLGTAGAEPGRCQHARKIPPRAACNPLHRLALPGILHACLREIVSRAPYNPRRSYPVTEILLWVRNEERTDDPPPSLHGIVGLVTGANRGAGRAIAAVLGQHGVTVYGGAGASLAITPEKYRHAYRRARASATAATNSAFPRIWRACTRERCAKDPTGARLRPVLLRRRASTLSINAFSSCSRNSDRSKSSGSL